MQIVTQTSVSKIIQWTSVAMSDEWHCECNMWTLALTKSYSRSYSIVRLLLQNECQTWLLMSVLVCNLHFLKVILVKAQFLVLDIFVRKKVIQKSIYISIREQIHVMNFRLGWVIDCAEHSGCHIKRKQMIRMKLVWHICERERFGFIQWILHSSPEVTQHGFHSTKSPT